MKPQKIFLAKGGPPHRRRGPMRRRRRWPPARMRREHAAGQKYRKPSMLLPRRCGRASAASSRTWSEALGSNPVTSRATASERITHRSIGRSKSGGTVLNATIASIHLQILICASCTPRRSSTLAAVREGADSGCLHRRRPPHEAFFTTNQVITLPFHKYGDFFPGTGHITSVVVGEEKHYVLNAPLSDGIDDATFRDLFQCVIKRVLEVYQPEGVVLQCGADSLAGDSFNLSMKGHIDHLCFLRSFSTPMIVLEGGGYTIIRNSPRYSCYETGVTVEVERDNKLPHNDYYESVPDFNLHIQPRNVENLCTTEDMENIKNMILDHLSKIEFVPSSQLHCRPSDPEAPEEREESMDNRPIQCSRLWSGGAYDSDTEYPDNMKSEATDLTTNTILKDE